VWGRTHSEAAEAVSDRADRPAVSQPVNLIFCGCQRMTLEYMTTIRYPQITRFVDNATRLRETSDDWQHDSYAHLMDIKYLSCVELAPLRPQQISNTNIDRRYTFKYSKKFCFPGSCRPMTPC